MGVCRSGRTRADVPSQPLVIGAVVALGVGLGLGVTGHAKCLNTYANGQQIVRSVLSACRKGKCNRDSRSPAFAPQGRHCPGTDSTSSVAAMPSTMVMSSSTAMASATAPARMVRERRDMLAGAILAN